MKAKKRWVHNLHCPKLSDQKVDYQQNMKFLLFSMSIILLTGSIGSEEQKGKYYAYLLSISRITFILIQMKTK